MRGRGRNGMFEIERYEAWEDTRLNEGKIFVDVYSKYTGKEPPIYIRGTREELIPFAREILLCCGIPSEQLNNLVNKTLVMLKLSGKE